MSATKTPDDRRPGKRKTDSRTRLDMPQATAEPTIPIQSSAQDSLAVQRAATAPRHLSSSDVLALQSTVGNRAVQRILQTPQAPTPARAASNATAGLLQRQPETAPVGQGDNAAQQTESERTAADPDWADPQLADTPADKYIFTIAVAVQFDEQLKFAMARARSTARNKMRGMLTKTPLFGIRGSKRKGEGDKVIKRGLFKLAAPKDQKEIKAKAARQTLEEKGETDIDEQKIAQMAARSTEVGHTWVKFRKMVGSDLKEVYSYGMWPEKGYGHPSRPVAGIILHPDTEHENAKGEKQLFLDTVVDPKKFNAGLQLAVARLKQKPDYVLTGYNCTAFAREVASKVGVSFPKAATVFPADPTRGFYQKVLSPNRLYESMEAMQGSGDKRITSETVGYDEIEQGRREARENEQLEAQERMERELDELPAYLVTRSTLFWPGESFGNEESFMVDETSDYRRVWSTGKTAQYHDPDLNAKMQYTLVKLVRFGEIVSGWLHTDAIEAFD